MAALNSKRRRRGRLMAEINITPFTDVVLVLLIIFMVMTPIISNRSSLPLSGADQTSRPQGESNEAGFDVNLPRASKASPIQTLFTQIVVAVLGDGRMAVGGEVLTEDQLKARFAKTKETDPQTLIVIQADAMVNHWRVVKVMNLATEVGLKRLAIATAAE